MSEHTSDGEHPYERPFLHDLSTHVRQSEPVALCESASALICGMARARDLLQDYGGAGSERDLRGTRSALAKAQSLCDMLRYVLSDEFSTILFCEESWIHESEITTGMLMAAVDTAR